MPGAAPVARQHSWQLQPLQPSSTITTLQYILVTSNNEGQQIFCCSRISIVLVFLLVRAARQRELQSGCVTIEYCLHDCRTVCPVQQPAGVDRAQCRLTRSVTRSHLPLPPNCWPEYTRQPRVHRVHRSYVAPHYCTLTARTAE